MFASLQNSYIEILVSRSEGIRKCHIWRALRSWWGSLKNRLIVLLRLHRDPSLFYKVKIQEEGVSSKQRGSSQDHEHAGNFLLDFPACRTVKNKWMLFTSYQNLVTAARTDQVCVCVQLPSHVWLFSAMRTIARQDPLSKGIFQARILEWIAISTSKRSSLSRDQTSISRVSNIRRRILYHCATWKPKQTKTIPNFLGFPGGTSGQEPACQCRRHKRHRFHP